MVANVIMIKIYIRFPKVSKPISHKIQPIRKNTLEIAIITDVPFPGHFDDVTLWILPIIKIDTITKHEESKTPLSTYKATAKNVPCCNSNEIVDILIRIKKIAANKIYR